MRNKKPVANLATPNGLAKRLEIIQTLSENLFRSQGVEEALTGLIFCLSQELSLESLRLCILDDTQNNIESVYNWHFEFPKKIEYRSIHQFSETDVYIKDLVRNPKESSIIINPPPSELFCAPPLGQTILVLPLVQQNKVIGTLGLGIQEQLTGQSPIYSDLQRLFSLALSNALLYEQLNKQVRSEQLINTIAREIRQSLSLETILKTTAENLCKYLSVSRCAVHFWQPDLDKYQTQMAQLTTQNNLPSWQNSNEWVEAEKQIFNQRAQNEHQFNPFILHELYAEFPLLKLESSAKSLKGLKSYALFPILDSSSTHRLGGLIALYQYEHPRAWLESEVRLIQSTAAYLSLALAQANLYETTQQQKKELEETLKELKSTQIQLIQSEKMAVLGQFVAGIAHEVNTPLGAVISNEDTLFKLLGQAKENPSKLLDKLPTTLSLLETNQEATKRILDIVQNLRNFARLDESDLKQVNLHEGIDSTLRILNQRLNENQVKVEKNYGNLPQIWCFPGLLNQVFQNLLVNSLQALNNQKQPLIKIETMVTETQVKLTFSDNGKGMNQEVIAKVFDPGFTTKGVGVGTGLGLAICYNIIEKHHGNIDVTSQPNQGTKVEVTLPLDLRNKL